MSPFDILRHFFQFSPISDEVLSALALAARLEFVHSSQLCGFLGQALR